MQENKWSSNFGFIMAIIASAVGLGSIWRFPYMVGSNGGSTFIFIYIIVMVAVGILGMAVELAMGRNSGKDAVDSYIKIAPQSKIFGYIFIFSGFMLMTIYSVLGGWVLHYLFQALTFQLTTLPTDHFDSFKISYQPLLWQLIFIFLTALILSAGVSKGIEKFSTWMNLLLLAIILLLIVRSLTLPNALLGVKFLFKPDLQQLTNANIWLMATGHALFSLSIGSGSIMAYGCYVDKKSNLLSASSIASFTTIIMALLVGLAIFPAIFSFGLSPAEGPSLLFNVLPQLFAQMPAGEWFAILFFIATFFAAITSAISQVEPALSRYISLSHLSRKRATWQLIGLLILISSPIALSAGVLHSMKILGLNLFDAVDFMLDKILFPFNAIIIFILAGWFWKDNGLIQAFHSNSKLPATLSFLLLWSVRLVLPLLLIIIMIRGFIAN